MSHNYNLSAKASLQRPPILVGYTYDPEDAYAARDAGRLLAIRLETNRSCNLACRYCYAESGKKLANEINYDVLVRVISEAHDLGAQSVVVIGGGEPTLYPHFADLISCISSHQMIPMVFTNAIKITADLADFLFQHDASIMMKLDSLRPDVQDFLAGREGAFSLMQEGLSNLLKAGFAETADPHHLRLGASFVSCRYNIEEIADIWHFCRQHHIFPNMEILTPTGRAKEKLPDAGLSADKVREYKQRILSIDRNCYGFDWLPYTPLAASGCLQHLYSIYITIEGNARPCAPTKFDEHPSLKRAGAYPHNILRRSLREIYEDPLFEYVRNIDQRLEGKCGSCEHHSECIGCRGYAYAVGVNEGMEPRAALRSECLQCFKPG